MQKDKKEASKTCVLDAELAKVQKQRETVQTELDKIQSVEDKKAQLETTADALDMAIEVLEEAVKKGNPETPSMVDDSLKGSGGVPE